MKVAEETFRQLLEKSIDCGANIILCIQMKIFAINCIHLFLSILLRGTICKRMTERGSPTKHIRKRCISRYSKVVHNTELPFASS